MQQRKVRRAGETSAPDHPHTKIPARRPDGKIDEGYREREPTVATKKNQLKLHHLRPAAGSRKRRTRVGRGESGRRGKTAGRGTKGLKARRKTRPGFEGGQTPLQSRIPHLPGFKPYKREEFTVVNVDRLTAFQADERVSLSRLRERGLVRKQGKVKVLGRGEIDRALTVEAHAFSGSAREKIEGAGGSCVVVG